MMPLLIWYPKFQSLAFSFRCYHSFCVVNISTFLTDVLNRVSHQFEFTKKYKLCRYVLAVEQEYVAWLHLSQKFYYKQLSFVLLRTMLIRALDLLVGCRGVGMYEIVVGPIVKPLLKSGGALCYQTTIKWRGTCPQAQPYGDTPVMKH